MNRVLTLLALLLLLSVAAYAQDVDFGAFGDPGSLLTPVAPAARGTAPARGGATPAPPPDRLVRLRDALTKAEAPLTREQETELNKLLDARAAMACLAGGPAVAVLAALYPAWRFSRLAPATLLRRQ